MTMWLLSLFMAHPLNYTALLGDIQERIIEYVNKYTIFYSNFLHCIERLLLNHAKMPGFLAPGGEEEKLDLSELLCNKFY